MAEIDSLPYYDTIIDKEDGERRVACSTSSSDADERRIGLRDRLEQEIADELAQMTNEDKEALSTRLPAELPPLFSDNAFLAAEIKRLQSKAKAKGGLDSVRYTLPVPPASAPLEAWNKATNNAASQLEHQKIRLGNLELLNKYGANAWRTNNFLLEKEIERLQRRKEEIVKQTEDLNRSRKANQVCCMLPAAALHT
jgi:pre-mRNA-splicing factor SPF27